MRLQEEELSQFQPQSTHSPQRTPVDPAITHVNDPSPRHGPPPITKEEYEQISQAERRGRSHSNVRYQYIHVQLLSIKCY